MTAADSPFSPSQLEVFTYPRLNIHDFSLDDNLPVFEPRVYEWTRKSRDLGALEVLPLELLQGLLVQLDLRALTDFRRVNQRALELVEATPQYKAITTHARNALRGSLIIGAGQFISCEKLYEKLCTAECEQCGDFGPYLYLLTCTRVCFLCLSAQKRFLPLLYGHATRKYGVPNQVLRTLPHMKSVPGSYATYLSDGKKARKRIALVDRESAYQAGITLHGSLAAMERYVADKAVDQLQKYDQRLSRTVAQSHGPTPRRPRQLGTEEGFDAKTQNPLRFMAIVRMPWLNKASREPEWGFHCIGCRRCTRCRPLHWRRRFNVASFSVHLSQCGDIRDGKHCTE